MLKLAPEIAKNIRRYKTLIRPLAKKMKASGGRMLIVGGAIRDAILKLRTDNIDVEVYGLNSEKIKQILRHYGSPIEVGKSFGVIKIKLADDLKLDVALPRRELKIAPGHRGFKITSDTDLPIKQALSRRDFTINSMAWDPISHELYDPFGGLKDLRKRMLRVTNPKKFAEDPLRVLRALQLTARFLLKMDPGSEKVLKKAVPHLKELSKERIQQEWKKMLLDSYRPSTGIKAGMRLGVFHALHPQFVPLIKTPQDKRWHPEGNVWEHTRAITRRALRIVRREKLSEHDAWVIVLAALCHDLGKATTTIKDGDRIRSPGHEKASVKPAKKFLEQIGADNQTKKQVLCLVENHMRPLWLYQQQLKGVKIGRGAICRLAADLAKGDTHIYMLTLLSEADFRGKLGNKYIKYRDGKWLRSQAVACNVLTRKAPDVLSGKFLIERGFKPGPNIGKAISLANKLYLDKNMSPLNIRKEIPRVKTGAGEKGVIVRLETLLRHT